jgi:hypothetical protein
VYSEDNKAVFRKKQRGIQKIPKRYSEENKRDSEDTKGVFRR